MDPVGASMGAVSLLFQVFSGCVQAYQLFSEARNFEKDYQYLRIRFKTEQHRLIDFATVAGISEQDVSLLINGSNRDLLLRVLDQQSRMMMGFGRLDDRLQKLAKPLVVEEDANASTASQDPDDKQGSLASRFPQNNQLLQKALQFAQHTTKYPGRIRWVLMDRGKVEDLIDKLVESNNFLQELLSSHQMELLRVQGVHTSYQIVQLNSKIDQIQEIVHATLQTVRGFEDRPRTYLGISFPRPGEDKASVLSRKLLELGQFRALASAAEENALTERFRREVGLSTGINESVPLLLDPANIVFDADGGERTSLAWYHAPDAADPRTRVWIEWKPVDPHHAHDSSDPKTLRRFKALIRLLREDEQTRHFRAPPCLGYTVIDRHDDRGPQYGLLFKNPVGVDPLLSPMSLRELIETTSGTGNIPSLTARVKLMQDMVQAVEKLHAVNWLHKGICSANIIFFLGGEDVSDATNLEPYLTGFDYSRPGTSVSMSSSPASTAREDLYRHPGVQGGGPWEGSRGAGYRKRHDIYSLGVVLTEVARWETVEDVLGVAAGQKIKARDVVLVRETLLSKVQTGRLRGAVGARVAEAVIACLTGMAAFGFTESDREDDGGQTAAELQMRFWEVVVRPIMDVKI